MGKDVTHGFGFGILCALLGASLWGFSGACAQYLFDNYEISSLFITFVRMLGAGALFLMVLFAFHRDRLKAIFADRTTLMQLCFFGSFGLFLDQFAYIMTIDFTNAGTATVLQGLNVLFVVVATCIIAKRRPQVRESLGVIFALASTVLIATKGDLGALNIPAAGLGWGIVNAASVAFYVMYPQRLFARWGSVAVTGLGMFIGGLVALLVFCLIGFVQVGAGVPIHEALPLPSLDFKGVLALLGVVVVGTFGAFGLYLHGVSVVGSVRGSLIGAVEPISAMLFAFLWLGTPFVGADWVGLVLMLVTIVLMSIRPKKNEAEVS